MQRLTTPFLTVLVASAAVLGCSDLNDTAGPDAALSATRPALVPQSQASAMVPYRADAAFAPGSPQLTVCDLPAGYSGDPVALPTLAVGEGQQTYLGRATTAITTEYCSLTAQGVLAGGHVSNTAPNGESLNGVWDALITPPTFVFVDNGKAAPIVVDGGTGRFEGVSGYSSGAGTVDLTTGAGTFSVQGWITTVGSTK